MEDTTKTKIRSLNGIHISESGNITGPEIDLYPITNEPFTWSYLFVHNRKVNHFSKRLSQGGITYFIHKTVIYRRKKESRGIETIEKPSVSGLIFMQGPPTELQHYLDAELAPYHLVNDCSTNHPAVIADSQMQPFMRVLEADPDRVRFLLHPFTYYADGNTKLRITSGFLAGLEGYVIRIDRNRHLVMNVGGMTVAISGIHCEKFEVVEE